MVQRFICFHSLSNQFLLEWHMQFGQGLECLAILITLIYSPLLYAKENDIQFKWKLIEIIASDIDTIKIDN